MCLLSMCDFVTSCVDHIENIGSLSYADLPNFNTFHYTTSKTILVNISTYIIKRVFKYWEAIKLVVEDTSLAKF